MSRLYRNGVPVDASLSARTQTRLVRGGIVLPGQPDFPHENLPEDITSLSDEELIQMFVRATEWTGYLAMRAASAAIDEKAAESRAEIAEAKALISSWGGTSKDRVTVSKAERSTDPDVIRLRLAHEEKYAERKLLDVLANNSERKAALLSRELTRRTSGPAPERRSNRFTSN